MPLTIPEINLLPLLPAIIPALAAIIIMLADALLRGKNKTVIDQKSRRIRAERSDFEKSLRQLQALRTVFSRHSQALFSHVGLDNLKRHVRDSRD